MNAGGSSSRDRERSPGPRVVRQLGSSGRDRARSPGPRVVGQLGSSGRACTRSPVGVGRSSRAPVRGGTVGVRGSSGDHMRHHGGVVLASALDVFHQVASAHASTWRIQGDVEAREEGEVGRGEGGAGRGEAYDVREVGWGVRQVGQRL